MSLVERIKIKCIENKTNFILGKENNEFSPNEQKLLNLYRKADDRGKRNIMHQAESEIQELSLTTNQKLSTSKIG